MSSSDPRSRASNWPTTDRRQPWTPMTNGFAHSDGPKLNFLLPLPM